MLLPSLFQLAVKSVAEQIHDDNIPIDFNLDIESSNAVVRELLELDPKNIEKLKNCKNQLSTLTELDLKKCKIDVEGILNLKNFKLNSLEFGDLYHLKTEFPDPSNSSGINIVSLLESAVNTQEMMIHLGFSGEEDKRYLIGWEEKVSKLLPSLQSIKINFDTFCHKHKLSNIYNSFPNLRILDISFAKGLSTLEGIKNLEHLQKLIMRNVELKDIYEYKELSELKNLNVLDVSNCDNACFRVIRSLLNSNVQMKNLEFLDCSMTFVKDYELKEFVKRHPSLKTVVAMITECNNSYIPTIDLLNYNSPSSTVKSLEYAIKNDREDLTRNCILIIAEKLNTNHDQLNDSEISEFLNALCYVLIDTKDVRTKYQAIACFARSSFFETKRFFNSFRLEIPGIVEFIFQSWEHLKFSETKISAVPLILTIFKRIVDSLRFGRIFQDGLLNFITEKTEELPYQYPENMEYATLILTGANQLMSLKHTHKTVSNNKKEIEELFDVAHRLINLDPSSYQQTMNGLVTHINQASKKTLKHLVSNFQAVQKCYEQFMIISESPTKDSQKNLSKIVLRLMTILNPIDPNEKTKALMSCSILSLLLAKNLVENRGYANTLLEQFNNFWVQTNLPNGLLTSEKYVELNTIFTSEYSTDGSICFGLKLMSTSINTEGFVTNENWNWMRETSERIQNNEKWMWNTRESASSVLNEMSTIEKESIS
ncbi:hypothetical protein B9Z55_004929 [Caenorhabditis nigoni]|uniref:Uncharacterized protein n=1 Tax=Caenorhabditis nigoni TaxID=1611254 RepID=A0A2G5UYM2_9PELO|nr:hypothetical protein B9Z55_004929 [Caenorhabditis nigoni]